ncbi:M14 family zinc carboxypeptidase, partial [Klebsiella pneumoniae]|uniref:M14 family zinc carboxypeptidase n=1 Tax=Klebsiella pneumoniae TaxID=573 RepID=UPI003EE10C3D
MKSVPPITAIREFFLKHQFKAALSGHAFGSMFLFPNGYTPQPCPDDAIYQQVTGHMAQVSGYKNIQCRKVPTVEPYHGFELD